MSEKSFFFISISILLSILLPRGGHSAGPLSEPSCNTKFGELTNTKPPSSSLPSSITWSPPKSLDEIYQDPEFWQQLAVKDPIQGEYRYWFSYGATERMGFGTSENFPLGHSNGRKYFTNHPLSHWGWADTLVIVKLRKPIKGTGWGAGAQELSGSGQKDFEKLLFESLPMEQRDPMNHALVKSRSFEVRNYDRFQTLVRALHDETGVLLSPISVNSPGFGLLTKGSKIDPLLIFQDKPFHVLVGEIIKSWKPLNAHENAVRTKLLEELRKTEDPFQAVVNISAH